jgi:hypothetical protein
VRRRRDLIAELGDRQERCRLLATAAAARLRAGGGHGEGVRSIVLTADPADSERASAELRTIAGPAGVAPRGAKSSGDSAVLLLRSDADARREEASLSRHPAVVVATPERLIDHIRRDNVRLDRVETVAVLVPDQSSVEQFSADLHFIYAKLPGRTTTIVFTSSLGVELDLVEDLLKRPRTVSADDLRHDQTRTFPVDQKEKTMKQLPFDPAEIKSKVREIVKAIHEDEDPVELTQYRKWVRRNTSIFNRGYILAYLLKYSAGGGGNRSRGRRGKSQDQTNRTESGRTAPETDESKQSIFVSIGRSKRVRARDLITFFTSADGVSQDDIGQVKVLDNYSFVEVNTEKAQAVIDALNGQEFRGRNLTVNFARKK